VKIWENKAMATGNITLPEDLLPKLEEVARAENRTADDLAKEAIEKLLKERSKMDLNSREWQDFIDENRRRAEELGIREEDVPEVVHQFRHEQRDRS
jgi:predicted transcriptional regulator